MNLTYIVLVLREVIFVNALFTSSFIKEYLEKSDSLLDPNNELLSKLSLLPGYNMSYPWSANNVPFWLDMANQALYLQYEHHKSNRKNLKTSEIIQKLPILIKKTDKCLLNPWSDLDSCSFKKTLKNLELLCLIDNTAVLKFTPNIVALQHAIEQEQTSNYKIFCWIIYALNYVEQCQSKLFLNEHQCSLQNIELLIKLFLQKTSAIVVMNRVYTNNFKTIYSHYVSLFKQRSMQILTQILVFLKQKKFQPNENSAVMFANELEFNLETLLNDLLNSYVAERMKECFKCKLFASNERKEYETNILREKLNELNGLSVQTVFDRVVDLIKKI